MAEVHYMSQEGLESIKKELKEALEQRPVISAAIAEAREKGDLSENAEYESAREAQSLLEIKIANLKNMVANAKVVDSSMLSTDKVQMLNTVKVENLNTHQKRARLTSLRVSLLRLHLSPRLSSATASMR